MPTELPVVNRNQHGLSADLSPVMVGIVAEVMLLDHGGWYVAQHVSRGDHNLNEKEVILRTA
jgi:hypothetical protein